METLQYIELLRILSYDALTGYLYWKIKPAKSINIGDIAGTKDQDGYIIITIKGKQYKAHRLAWFYIHGYMPENMIDHKDRIRYHNWILNLRESTNQCNQRNTGNPKDNTSGVKGVYLHKRSGKWMVSIRTNDKNTYLGLYSDFDEAVCTRLAGEQCIDWEGCDSHSPAYKYVRNNIQKHLNGGF